MTEAQAERISKFDRHIPVMVAIAIQTLIFAWWMGAQDQRIETAIAINARQDSQIEAAQSSLASQQVTAATATADLRAVREGLVEVKETLADQNTLLREILTNGKGKP